jgi:NADH-quinone oxidoreductase subunit E
MPILEEQALDTHERSAIDQIIAQHEGRSGALLGILADAQSVNSYRFLSMPALRYIAENAGVPPARVYSAATFFALFNLQPQGDNVICVCRGTACHTRGSRDLLNRLCIDLGFSAPDTTALSEADKLALTTADRRFTIRTVACFGQCALAPVVEVNHHILSHVNERAMRREIESLGQRKK